MCAVEDKFRRPAVPLRGHFPDDITGHPDGARRPQPGAARLQTPGQSAGSPSFGQHLPAHLHDRGGSTGRPLHDHVAGMVGGALPAEAPSQGNILTGGFGLCSRYIPLNSTTIGQENLPNMENSSVFLLSGFQFIIMAVVVTKGYPHKKPLYYNCE